MRLKSSASNVAIALAFLVGLFLVGVRVSTQTGTLVFGSSSPNVSQVIKATSSALWVSVQSQAAGTGGATFKAGGTVLQNLVSATDAATINQWNVSNVVVPANTVVNVGDTLVIKVPFALAANANAKAYQIWWALNSATCSGTSGNLCNSGCQLGNNTSTSGSGSNAEYNAMTTKTSGGNHKTSEWLTIAASVQENVVGSCAIDETQATQIAVGWRNTAASAASIAGNEIIVWFYPH